MHDVFTLVNTREYFTHFIQPRSILNLIYEILKILKASTNHKSQFVLLYVLHGDGFIEVINVNDEPAEGFLSVNDAPLQLPFPGQWLCYVTVSGATVAAGNQPSATTLTNGLWPEELH